MEINPYSEDIDFETLDGCHHGIGFDFACDNCGREGLDIGIDDDEEHDSDLDLENMGLCPHGLGEDDGCDEPGCHGGATAWDSVYPPW